VKQGSRTVTPTFSLRKFTFVAALALFATVGSETAGRIPSRQAVTAKPCSAPEFRQFDFWLGDWDAFDIGKSAIVARTHVDPILDGCVLREDYQSAAGLKGQSFSIYDPSRKVWHQSWVTNRGQLLVIEGKLEAGEMILAGADRTADGKERRVRGIWRPVDGGVRETAVTSTDAGSTWQPWFDIIFLPHVQQEGTTAPANDDFALVTGSGKTYTKADLLDEARSGRYIYEHQEDTAQTVRVWGNTATVTAKLWAQGTDSGKPFDYTVWFTDTYVRYPTGWRYVFGQSSLPLRRASE
jgi:Domain of unknown function (DUF4440)